MHYKRIMQKAVVCTAVAAVISTSNISLASTATGKHSTNENYIMLIEEDHIMPINVDVEQTTWTSGNTTIELIGDTLTVTANPGTDGVMADIPIDWKDIVGKVRSIDVKPGVTHIGQNAFKGLTYAESALIDVSVTSMGDGAFADCSNLSSTAIPNRVTTFGKGVFDNSNLVVVQVYYGSAAHVAISNENVKYTLVDFDLPFVDAGYKFDHTSETEFTSSIDYGTSSTFSGIKINDVAVSEDKYKVEGDVVSINASAFDGLGDEAKITYCFTLDYNNFTMDAYSIITVRLTSAGDPVVFQDMEYTFFSETQSDIVIPVEMNGAGLEKIELDDVVVPEENYTVENDAVVISNDYARSLAKGWNHFIIYFNDGSFEEAIVAKEDSFDDSTVPAVLGFYSELGISGVVMKYTLGIGDDAANEVAGILVDGVEYNNSTRTYGSVYTIDEQNRTITVNASFIENLSLNDGYHVFGATFTHDNNTKSSSKTVLVRKEENGSNTPDSSNPDNTNPETGVTPPTSGEGDKEEQPPVENPTPTPPTDGEGDKEEQPPVENPTPIPPTNEGSNTVTPPTTGGSTTVTPPTSDNKDLVEGDKNEEDKDEATEEEKVVISPVTLSMNQVMSSGGKLQLGLYNSEEYRVSFRTSDASLVYVTKKGLLKASKSKTGKAVVTCRLRDQEGNVVSVISIHVNVKKGLQAEDTFSDHVETEDTQFVMDKKLKVGKTLASPLKDLPEGAVIKIKASNKKVKVTRTGKIKAKKAGNTTVTYTVTVGETTFQYTYNLIIK